MKPSTRTIDYVTLVQNGIMTVDQVPTDIKAEVTKWVRYFQGIDNVSGGVVKDQPTQPVQPNQVTNPDDKKELIINDSKPNN